MPPSDQTPIPNPRPAVCITKTSILFLFVLCLFGPWLWFKLPAQNSSLPAPIQLVVKTNLPGYTFVSEPLGTNEIITLQTTNIINGVFVRNEESGVSQQPALSSLQQTGIRVFAAQWTANDATSMSVVHHTPDICWVGSGWKSIDLGQPSNLTIKMSQPTETQSAEPGLSKNHPNSALSTPGSPLQLRSELPFECRVFQSPSGNHRELVVWCTLVGGQILAETKRWHAEEDSVQNAKRSMLWASRRVAASHFFVNLLNRRTASGFKQFVRFSTSIDSNWGTHLQRLTSFGERWIDAEATTQLR